MSAALSRMTPADMLPGVWEKKKESKAVLGTARESCLCGMSLTWEGPPTTWDFADSRSDFPQLGDFI